MGTLGAGVANRHCGEAYNRAALHASSAPASYYFPVSELPYAATHAEPVLLAAHSPSLLSAEPPFGCPVALLC